jgi:hypothetical protein
MWKDFITNLIEESEYAAPASLEEIDKVEQVLNVKFPEELRNLLCETNGVKGEYKIDLIWSLYRIKSDNELFRNNTDFKELFMPFDHLLFFADAGNGDQFAYSILNGAIRKNDVYVWNHEDDSRTWVAPSMKKFIEWWSDGTIKV